MKSTELLTHPVSAAEQPELWWLVHDTARRAGLVAPEFIELYAAAEVQVHRNRLLLGLPYVTDLAADELAAVIAHELAYSQTRWDSTDYVVRRPAGGQRSAPPVPRGPVVAERVGSTVAPAVAPTPAAPGVAPAHTAGGSAGIASDSLPHRVELAADALAAEILSPEVVAGALVRAAHLGLAFHRFVRRYVQPLAEVGWYPVDLWDGWRWTPTLTGGAIGAAEESCRRLVRGGLAARVAALVGSPEAAELLPGGRPVPLRPLGAMVETGFARMIAEGLAGTRELRPATFDGLADDVWDLAMRRRAESVRRVAAELLGMPAAFVPDILDLVRAGRSAELLRAGGAAAPDLDPASWVLTPLLYEALRFRGYRVEHPLRQDVLIGPAHDRIDLEALLGPVECGEPMPGRVHDILLAR